MLKTKIKAPEFSLPDQNGNIHKLSDYLGNYVLIYFYPKDDTPGCTKEACGFRDIIGEFKKMNTVVLGISKDSIVSHKKFEEKYSLNFTILSDESKKILKAYNAWGQKKFLGKTFEGTLRISYLVDQEGKIIRAYPNVNPVSHPQQIIEDIKKLA